MFVDESVRDGEIESFVQKLGSQELDQVPDAWLQADFETVSRLCERLEVESLRRLAEIEARGLHSRDGHLSAASWLSDRQGLSFTKASQKVLLARDLSKMGPTMDALRASRITLDAAKTLAWARREDPQAFSGSESMLVEAARRHSPQGIARVCSAWRQHAAEQALGEGSNRDLFSRRRLHASRTLLGMVRVDADLDPIAGDALLCAINAIVDAEAKAPPGEPDRRSHAQKRADALGEISCSTWAALIDPKSAEKGHTWPCWWTFRLCRESDPPQASRSWSTRDRSAPTLHVRSPVIRH